MGRKRSVRFNHLHRTESCWHADCKPHTVSGGHTCHISLTWFLNSLYTLELRHCLCCCFPYPTCYVLLFLCAPWRVLMYKIIATGTFFALLPILFMTLVCSQCCRALLPLLGAYPGAQLGCQAKLHFHFYFQYMSNKTSCLWVRDFKATCYKAQINLQVSSHSVFTLGLYNYVNSMNITIHMISSCLLFNI